MQVLALVSLKTPRELRWVFRRRLSRPHGLADQEFFVSTTIRLYFDALIAVATMIVVAVVCGFVASVIIGDSPPNFPVAGIALVLTGLVLFLRLWRSTRHSALPPS
jgi:protein-S-isoprenylcysteine O-methyltransferase Ste14